MTVSAETHAKLRHAQDLLRHVVANGDPAVIFDRALTLLIGELERTKFAKKKGRAPHQMAVAAQPVGRRHGKKNAVSARPDSETPAQLLPDTEAALESGVSADSVTVQRGAGRLLLATDSAHVGKTVNSVRTELTRQAAPSGGPTAACRSVSRRPRGIPSAVKRAVWTRDGGQCTFVGTAGRCPERGFLEYHHKVPFAAGGPATVENVVVMCRSHNNHEAERFFGAAALAGQRSCAGRAMGQREERTRSGPSG
jgi:hypothetical protein